MFQLKYLSDYKNRCHNREYYLGRKTAVERRDIRGVLRMRRQNNIRGKDLILVFYINIYGSIYFSH